MRRAASWGQPLQLISGPRAARTGLGPALRSVNSAPLLHAVGPKISAGGPGSARRDLLALFVHKFAGLAAPRPARIALPDQLRLFGAYESGRRWRHPSVARPRRRASGRAICQPPDHGPAHRDVGSLLSNTPTTHRAPASVRTFLPGTHSGQPGAVKEPPHSSPNSTSPARSVGERLARAPTGPQASGQRGAGGTPSGCHQPASQLTGVVWGPSAARAGTRFAAMGVPRPVTGSQPRLAL